MKMKRCDGGGIPVFLCLLFSMVFSICQEVDACTSFMLKTDRGLFFVHSLNQGDIPGVPGDVFINPRGRWKRGYSWKTLVDVNDRSDPGLVWKSKYGSVTFNTLGKDYIDGGMNEEGLYIWEMSFDTRYPSDENQPVLFQMLWMQYQLDNFRTVEEVIENVSRVSIDGWGWHYFVADRSGKTAVIDFIGGRAVVYTGEDMPVPICCNSVYPDALKWLRQHRGFGGDLAIEKIRQEIPRFVYGAELMRRYGSQDPVKYSFNMLAEMSQNVRWSVVIDVEDLTVHFKTNLNQKVRRFRLTRADFKGDETLMLNIEHPGPEQIRNEFVPCTPDRNRRSIGAFFDLVCEHYPPFRKALLDDQGVTIDQLVTGFQDKIWGSSPPAGRELPGIWIGEIKFPTRDGWKEYPVNLRLSAGNESLSGTVEIVGFMEECPITNVQNRGGLLYFTHKHPQSGEVSQFQLYQTAEGIKGAAESWNRRKKAVVSLSRSEAVGN